jgi:hypothetical protein
MSGFNRLSGFEQENGVSVRRGDEIKTWLDYYGGWTKTFCSLLLTLSLLNSLARSDCTFGIGVVGLISILSKHKPMMEVYVATLLFSFVIDIVWAITHGIYLNDYGKVPKMASISIAGIMQMHKFSMGISVILIMIKIPSMYFAFQYWRVLPRQLDPSFLPLHETNSRGARGASSKMQ